MILPSSTSRKRELAIGTALKQFNVDPQPIATDRVTNAFNNLRNSVFTRIILDSFLRVEEDAYDCNRIYG